MTADHQAEHAALRAEHAQMRQRIAELEQQLTIQSQQFDQELQTIFDSVTDALFLHTLDDTGTILKVNQAMLDMYQVDRDTATAYRVQDYSSPQNSQEDIAAALQQAAAGGIPSFAWRARRPLDNTEFDAHVTLRKVTFQQQPCILATVRDVTERRQIETEQQMFRALVENAPDAIGVSDMHGNFAYANPAYGEMTGYGDDLLGMPVTAILPSESLDVGELIGQILNEDVTWRGELLYQHKDGYQFPGQVVVFAVRDAADQVLGIAAIVRDISERRRQEAELHIFKTVFENMPDGIGITNTEGIITHSNPAHQRLFGYGEDTVGQHISDTVAPESAAMLSDVLGDIMSKGSWSGESLNRDKAGRVFPVDTTVFALRDVQGQMYGMAGVVRDISDRKQQEADVQIFKTMAETAPDGFGMADADGILTYANTAYKALTGYGDDLVGMRFTDHFDADELPRAFEALTTTATRGEWRGVLEFQRKDGSRVPVDSTGFVARDEAGNITAVMGLFRDLTEQRQAEAEREMLQQQIINAQRSALRELSTPLIPISNEVVIMPLIGTIDSGRAQQVLETLLEGVAQYQASLAILDITGVSIVDTQVAQSLVSAAQAVRLLGAQVMLTGIQPQIAQTLVHLGVDLGTIVTQGTLQAGIAAALRQAS